MAESISMRFEQAWTYRRKRPRLMRPEPIGRAGRNAVMAGRGGAWPEVRHDCLQLVELLRAPLSRKRADAPNTARVTELSLPMMPF